MHNSNAPIALISILGHLEPREFRSVRRERQTRHRPMVVRGQVSGFGGVGVRDVEDVDIFSGVEGIV